MLNKVRTYIEHNNLLDKQHQHLVALSGGADSVCLLLIMRELGYHVHAVHCNFHLRGEESNRDEAFAKALCERLDIPFHVTHFDTLTYAELHKVSIEMAARELRYGYFEQLRMAIDADDIIVAHHRDDNVETLLMNIIRGTGLSGLQAIKPCNGRIKRPLLCVSRKDIETFLQQHNQDFVTDSTNLVDDVTRNKLRLNVIPMLESINPSAAENIARTIENISEIAKIVDAATEHSKQQCCSASTDGITTINRNSLLAQSSPEYTLFSILSPAGFQSMQIKQIFESIMSQPGKIWHSATHTLATDRDALLLAHKTTLNDAPLIIPEHGTYIYKVSEEEQARIIINKETKADGFTPSRNPHLITIDADKVSFPLTLRLTQNADRFTPFGMRGSKLVSDYLTDRKRNFFQRQRQLVLVDAEDMILWLVGERVSQHVACSDDTINVLNVRYLTDEK